MTTEQHDSKTDGRGDPPVRVFIGAKAFADRDESDGDSPPKSVPQLWPWATGWWKPKGRRHDLVRAAALIIAEIERLDRLSAKGGAG